MNKPVAAPDRLQPAACPLLAAVLPVRYAIGPVDLRHPSSLDSATLGLPELNGNFPELGPDHPQLQDAPLSYVPRMLRDGYLYLWDETLQELSEYRVEGALLTLTDRGSGLIGQATGAYLMLAAGAPVRISWSPCAWSDDCFVRIEQEPALRQRMMRELTPGAAPSSGQIQALHPEIGDVKPENFGWSCAPDPPYWLLEDPPLKRMQRCEQQHFALVDDPWGVLMDTAGLIRARNHAFEKLSAHRDEWSIAAIVQSMGDGDTKIRQQIASSIDQSLLQRALREQERETSAHATDILRLADIWAAWFETFGGNTAASLESACEGFDIQLTAAREMLEVSFAAACLGPAATSPGVKAIERALDLEQIKGQPWLLWAVLGVKDRLDGGHLQRILSLPDSLPTVTEDAGEAAARWARISALATALNLGADNLEKLPLAGGGEPLFAAVSTVIGGRLASLSEQVHQQTYILMIAMLARSKQRFDATRLTPEEAMRWVSELIGTAHNNSQKRRLEKERSRLERQQRHAEQGTAAAAVSAAVKNRLSSEVKRAVPFLRLVPKPTLSTAAPATEPRQVTPPSPARPAPAVGTLPTPPRLGGHAAGIELPSIRDLLNEAPLKTLIALVSVWNLKEAMLHTQDDRSAANRIAAGSAFWTTASASTAVLQQLAEVSWEKHVAQAGYMSPTARQSLARALGVASYAMLFQTLAAGLDVFYFGWKALLAYRQGDLDSAGVYVGLTSANLALTGASLKAVRALRIARAAVLAGEAQALLTGVRVLSLPLRLTLVGLAVTILAGLVGLFFTEDEPLEQWLKQLFCGARPATWSGSLTKTLQQLYQIVLPVTLKLERWHDINPRTGQLVEELRLVLELPGQQEYRQGMVSFEGTEHWQYSSGLFGLGGSTQCLRLAWDEHDTLPFYPDIGNPARASTNGLRLCRAYHETNGAHLAAIRGSLTYQPVEELYLPAIDIDIS
ncbi:toxin VasX [Halopseudomonas sabulinigri]|uniref:Toxin VasX N-terminal region domain-containing protein n=1 Tax=Halopseudomonas sabulinigri TaxID=472181 RepID=A0ABP9ZPU9_9GAMM